MENQEFLFAAFAENALLRVKTRIQTGSNNRDNILILRDG